MTEFQCIYCKQIKSASEYSNTEHIIPESFGKFDNNFTLNLLVCNNCNQYFGDNLEIDLARDTMEGLYRYNHGVKQPSDFKSLGRRSHLQIRVDEGQFEGAYVYLEYSTVTGKLVIRPIRQVGFYNAESKKYTYYSLEEIPNISDLNEKGYDLSIRNSVIALGINSDTAKEILAKSGIIIRSWGDIETLEPSEVAWDVEVEGRFDSILLRAISKIAFNYFCYWKGGDLSRQTEFDVLRSFIREGLQPSYPLIKINDQPILADEPNVGLRRLGHIITLNWSDDKKSLVSMVSLFNLNTYSVCISRNYLREIQNLAIGHFFDITNRKILQLKTM
jgi:hypothetical protein